MSVETLNNMQIEAVNHIDGPMLVLAGAGSGKTKVLTNRIANLIENGVYPGNILAITFTNKAAKEMRERVVKLIGMDAKSIQISTFHSLGLRILKENYSRLGYKSNFVILDSDDTLTVVKKIMKEMNLIPADVKIMVVGSVQEEDCDGLCWQYIIKEDKIVPEFVVSTEPTDGGIYRGHRGRMEIRVDVKGIYCHGSAPERGDNAIYKMADILEEVRALNENDTSKEIKGLVKMLDPKYNKESEAANFLGKGTITVSQIGYTSPSRCAVADSCWVSLDRRMTAGETFESCLQEIRDLPACKKYAKDVVVSMYNYDSASYTGLQYPIECYFPTWWLAPEHPLCKSMVETYKSLFGTEKRIGEKDTIELREKRPLLDKWTFSTNGVTIKGRNGVDCIGFGPGAEAQAHAPNEITWKKDLVTCAAMYAALPTTHAENVKK